MRVGEQPMFTVAVHAAAPHTNGMNIGSSICPPRVRRHYPAPGCLPRIRRHYPAPGCLPCVWGRRADCQCASCLRSAIHASGILMVIKKLL